MATPTRPHYSTESTMYTQCLMEWEPCPLHGILPDKLFRYKSSFLNIPKEYHPAEGFQRDEAAKDSQADQVLQIGQRAKLKVKVRLNLHGIVSVKSAIMLEEEETEVPLSPVYEPAKESVKMDTDEPTNSPTPAESDVHMQDVKSNDEPADSGDENGAPETENNPYAKQKK